MPPVAVAGATEATSLATKRKRQVEIPLAGDTVEGVAGITDRQWFMGALLLYGIGAVYSIFLWRKGTRRHDLVAYGCLALAFALTTAAMVTRGLTTNKCPIQNLYQACTFVIWTISAMYVIAGVSPRFRVAGAFVSPVLFAMCVFALMPALDRHQGAQPDFTLPWASVHAAIALLSYGAFALAAVASLMYLVQEHTLKHNKMRALMSLLPPIQRLEAAMSGLLVAGFVLFSLGLAVSWLIVPPTRVDYHRDAKVIWSGVVWGIYAFLVILRWRFNRRGRRLGWGLMAAFVFVLMTFWWTSLISPIHNPRSRAVAPGGTNTVENTNASQANP